MKQLVSFLVIIIFSTNILAQKNIFLDFDHLIDGNELALNQDAYVHTDGDYKVTRLQYYISEIELVHDNGQITPLTDVYLLVNANQKEYSLGSYNIENLEAINFKIGVPESINHGDPSIWDAGHPLAPQSPTMHWGWAAGYRFVAFEGDVSPNSDGNFISYFQFHVVGDEFYTPVSLQTSGQSIVDNIIINIETNYAAFLNEIEIDGAIEHGGGKVNEQLMLNINDFQVFKAIEVEEPEPTVNISPLSIKSPYALNAPNPFSTQTVFDYYFDANDGDLSFQVFDVNGKLMFQQQNLPHSGWFNFNKKLDAGIYFYTFSIDKNVLSKNKMIVK